ncbi:thioesterase II family protein [Paenibacillus sp. IHBB 10380]|uniref:thioesterase II family protein n=1 Tax=Paenibacillus sp. IHBB 10380 TaxID=1566358 RepID=UPI0005CFD505|nr:alpha/beta fold hydrolase [Paenibacillus sp. IHBB 10380]AJS58704.1 hypothetical protein UB51_09650 [Paenibacillus sp. IHBB 10380]
MTNVNLFCFPYAGGSAMFYKKWPQVRGEITVYPVELAGRGSRASDPNYQTLSQAVDEACNYVELHNAGGPYALFGHSMGGLLAYETACRLVAAGYRGAEHLFLSSTRCPHEQKRSEPTSHLSDDAFIQKIMDYRGTPDEVFKNKELKEYVLPILRSDFSIIENHRYEMKQPIDCPLTILYSTNDTVNREDVEPWADKTIQDCEFVVYPGTHFYILNYMDEVYSKIVLKLANAGRLMQY